MLHLDNYAITSQVKRYFSGAILPLPFEWLKHKLKSWINCIHNSDVVFNSVYYVGLTLIICIFVLLVCLVIARTIYKIGFYGKQEPFETKYDFNNFYLGIVGNRNHSGRKHIKQSPTHISHLLNIHKPEWNKYCDIDKTTIIDTFRKSDENINNSIIRFINDSTTTHDYGSKFDVKQLECCLTTHNTTAYVAAHSGLYDSLDCVFICISSTLKIATNKPQKIKQDTEGMSTTLVSIPIYNISYFTHQNYSKENCVNTPSFQKTFATFHYFQLSNNPKAQVSIFKAKHIWNVVPLCIVTDKVFKIDNTLDYNFASKKALDFFVAGRENMACILDLLNDNMPLFDIVITPEISYILELSNLKKYVIIGCNLNGVLIGVLFFKVNIQDGNCISLIASVFDHNKITQMSKDVGSAGARNKYRNHKYSCDIIMRACFSRGLILAKKTLGQVCVKHNQAKVDTTIDYVVINNTSHNKNILDMIDGTYKGVNVGASISTSSNEYSYYLRNFRITDYSRSLSGFDPVKCLIIE